MRITKSGLVLLLLVLVGSLPVTNLMAAEALVEFSTEQQAEHYQALLKRYRCLKCQNQNLADSAAELAEDLSREIAAQVVAGKSTSNIDDYLVQRYGEFVLYKPRFKASTLMLWLGPFVLLLLALLTAARWVRKSSTQQVESAAVDVEEARRLLKD